jgi:deoxyadenosine/deoxycytidine kinase
MKVKLETTAAFMLAAMADFYVVASGPVGVGKTTLCQALAKEFGWICGLESDGAGNPFLADAYADPERWAFASNAFSMVEAFAQQTRIAATDGGVIQDRVLDEHLAMFALPRFESGVLSEREYELLRNFVEVAASALPSPDLLVYAYAPADVVFERIRARGREYEQHFTLADVSAECERYEGFVSSWRRCPVLGVDVSKLDVRTPEGSQSLVVSVREALVLKGAA